MRDVGEGAVVVLRVIGEVADAFPPLKSALNGALEIISLVKVGDVNSSSLPLFLASHEYLA
jgi:hypothetical protein